MPRNANTGVYTPPANSWNPATPDTVISSADWNALRADMATALNHAPATTRALHPTTGQVQDGAFIWGGTAGGTADALTLTLTPAITAYATGMVLRFRVGAASNVTTTPTLAVNGLPAHIITRYDGTALAAGDLPANAVIEVLYDGVFWRLLLTATSQIQGNDGSTAVTSAASITLTSASTRVQVVNITTEQKSVFLPNAKTITIGGPRFYVRNAGSKTFALRSSNENQVINGGFDNQAAWVLGAGWSISGGVATKIPGSAADIEQTLGTNTDVTYKVTYTVTSVNGGAVRAVLKGGGPDVLGPLRNTPGTYTETLASTGNTTLALRADASFDGSIDDVSVTLAYPPLLAGMPPGAVAECVLEDNSTVQGRWHVIGQKTTAAVPVVDAVLPSTLRLPNEFRTLKMTETLSLHFARNASGHPFVFAVDYGSSPPVIGSPVLISASDAPVRHAFRLTESKAFIIVSPSPECFIISVSGTSCSISSSSTTNPNLFSSSFLVQPWIDRLGANNDIFVAIGATSNDVLAQAVDASGVSPVSGNVATLFAGSYDNSRPVRIFRIDNNRAVVFYVGNNLPRAVVLTVTGTSIDVGSAQSVNNSISDINKAHGVVCQISSTSYVWVYGTGNNVRAVAITVSGNSVTFGTPITITTFPSSPEVQFALGDIFNPVIFYLDENRVFVAFRRIAQSEWNCVILTVNELTVSAGPIFSFSNQELPLFINHNEKHTVLVQRSTVNSHSTGRIIGINHYGTEIEITGSLSLLGVARSDGLRFTTTKLKNGVVCIRYDTTGIASPNDFYSSRMEVFAPMPNGEPTSLGNFTIPEILWNTVGWPLEVSPRRLAFVGHAELQQGATPRVKLCIMEVVSWPH